MHQLVIQRRSLWTKRLTINVFRSTLKCIRCIYWECINRLRVSRPNIHRQRPVWSRTTIYRIEAAMRPSGTMHRTIHRRQRKSKTGPRPQAVPRPIFLCEATINGVRSSREPHWFGEMFAFMRRTIGRKSWVNWSESSTTQRALFNRERWWRWWVPGKLHTNMVNINKEIIQILPYRKLYICLDIKQ